MVFNHSNKRFTETGQKRLKSLQKYLNFKKLEMYRDQQKKKKKKKSEMSP